MTGNHIVYAGRQVDLDYRYSRRHGPAGIEPLSGDVIGFVLTLPEEPSRSVYVTGDTVW